MILSNYFRHNDLISLSSFGFYDKIPSFLKSSDKRINDSNDQGELALVEASKYSHRESNLETVRTLLNNGASPIYKDKSGETPLMASVARTNSTSHLDTVKMLLSRGADPDSKNHSGETALMIACYNVDSTSSLEVVEYLLDNPFKKATLETSDYDGNTALLISVFNGRRCGTEVIKRLLEYGSNINQRNRQRYDSLAIACQYSNSTSSLETVKYLIENVYSPATINSNLDKGMTPLFLASKYSNTTSNLQTVKYLVEKGANLYHRDYNGENVLFHVCRQLGDTSNLDTLKYLVEKGANVKTINFQKSNLLDKIVDNSSHDLLPIKYLLSQGVDINNQDITGNTPLMTACRGYSKTGINFYLDSIFLLIQNGADADIKNKWNISAKDIYPAIRLLPKPIKLRISTQCLVCYENPAEIGTLPCGHISLCKSCYFHLESQTCPLCRKDIENLINIEISD